MASEWKTYPISEFVTLSQGLAINAKTKKLLVDDGLPLLRITDLINNTQVQFIDAENVPEKSIATDEELIFTRTGQVGLVYRNKVGVVHNNCFKVIPSEGVDKDYLYWFLFQESTKRYVNAVASGSVQKDLNHAAFLSLTIPIPEITEQKKIAQTLDSLDFKIELNRQMNETLEAMAQALFKSWFVDFDPVIDNALLAGKAIPEPLKQRAEMRQAQLDSGKAKTNSEINDLFPSEFEFTEELGWIPRGWSIANFGDLLKSTIGGDWGKPEPDEKHTIPSVIIRGTDIPDLKTGNRSAAPKRWVEAKKLKTRKLEPYDIVIEISGGSPTQSTGRSIIINENLLERLGGTVEPASFCRRFTPIDKYIGVYAGIHLQKIYDDGKMWEYQNQSTGIANFQTTSFLEREILVLPNKELIVKYYELVNPLINKMTSNQQIELAKLRDTLLPKLMSGELRIADAEKLAENI